MQRAQFGKYPVLKIISLSGSVSSTFVGIRKIRPLSSNADAMLSGILKSETEGVRPAPNILPHSEKSLIILGPPGASIILPTPNVNTNCDGLIAWPARLTTEPRC